MEDLILKHTLANALEHEGKADVAAVIGKIIAEKPELKEKIKEIIPEVKKIIKEVNGWSAKKQESQLKKFKYKKIEKVERVGLPPLPGAIKGKVVTRFPPYPSGALHIGNMKAAVTSYEYAKMYDGKFVVRVEDTDPDPEKINKENVELIKKDLDALGLKADIFYLCSSQFGKQYKYAESLIKENKAYICTCKTTGVKDKSAIVKEMCACRDKSSKENLDLFKKMFNQFKEGEAVLRLKAGINDPNPALRDPAMLRIKEGVHPITGKEHRVYPLYNFNCAIEDHDHGITHVLRGTEHAANTLIQKKIYEAFKWDDFPHVINFGFLYMPGEKVHKRFIRDAIKEGKFTGFDDPRLGQYGLIRALIRRGIRSEAIKNMIIEMGVNPQTVHFEWEKLYTENRKIIDPAANRYFAVLNPVQVSVKKAPKIESVEIKFHPEFPKRGKRKVPVDTKRIYVEKEDLEKLKGKDVGMMNLFSVKMKENPEFLSKKIEMDIQKIHWVSEPNVKIRIIMPDGDEKEAIAEKDITKVKENEMVQLVRVGFCRVDKVNKDIVLYYAHK